MVLPGLYAYSEFLVFTEVQQKTGRMGSCAGKTPSSTAGDALVDSLNTTLALRSLFGGGTLPFD